MLTKRERMEDTNRFNRYGFLAAFVGLGLFALLVRAIGASSSAALASGAAEASGQAASPGSAVSISNMLLGDMALPLEASALLLLAALAGAIVIGKGTRKNK